MTVSAYMHIIIIYHLHSRTTLFIRQMKLKQHTKESPKLHIKL